MSRIIAGSRRGHRIQSPPGGRTRPTTDRVREAVFSAIGSWAGQQGDLTGISMLDLYAGSGAVGLEAASRGASPVTLVEADARTAKLITTNAATIDLPVTVVADTVARFLNRRPTKAVDIAWFDPPYDLDTATVEAECNQLVTGGWLAEDGLIVVERSTRSSAPTWPDTWDSWSRRYGETTIYYAQPSGE